MHLPTCNDIHDVTPHHLFASSHYLIRLEGKRVGALSVASSYFHEMVGLSVCRFVRSFVLYACAYAFFGPFSVAGMFRIRSDAVLDARRGSKPNTSPGEKLT